MDGLEAIKKDVNDAIDDLEEVPANITEYESNNYNRLKHFKGI